MTTTRTNRSLPANRTFRTFATLDEREEREICARIKQARVEAGLTQQQAADLLHIEKRTYQNYEDFRVPFRSLEEIGNVLGKPKEWLLYGDGPEFTNRIARMEEAMKEMDRKLDRVLTQMRATPVRDAVKKAGRESRKPADESRPARRPKGNQNRRGS
jgi:transcriptional regulator with XRE-family HTH domain